MWNEGELGVHQKIGVHARELQLIVIESSDNRCREAMNRTTMGKQKE